MPNYRVLTGIDYPPDRRAEEGAVVSDIPEKSAKWLLDQGLIESADGKNKVTKNEPVVKVSEEVTYDPNAKDGDGDGLLQDGTSFQRPVEEK